MRWPSPGLTSIPGAPLASAGSALHRSLHMRPAAKTLLSAARKAAAVQTPRTVGQSSPADGGSITATLLCSASRAASSPAWKRCLPALALPSDDRLPCACSKNSESRSQARGRHQLAACRYAQLTACSAHGSSGPSIPQCSSALLRTSSNSSALCGGGACGGSSHRWAASGTPGGSTAARAVAEESVETREPEVLTGAQSAGHDQAPLGASASETSECGEHTGETDDDEAAACADVVPWREGQTPSHEAKARHKWRMGARVRRGLRSAVQTYYTVVFYNTITRVLKWLGAGSFFEWVTPLLEKTYARLSGIWYELPNGRREPFSLANNYDPGFSPPPPYDPREFPFHSDLKDMARYDPEVAHFLALCVKVVYEHDDVLIDIAERQWGIRCHAVVTTENDFEVDEAGHNAEDMQPDDIETGARHTEAQRKRRESDPQYVPSTKAIVLQSPRAIIVSFRGTEATNLLNWQTNITINMTCRDGLGGVHDGFYAALFHRPEGSAVCLFDELVYLLKQVGSDEEGGGQLPLFLTGHSLGGAIASVFAAALQVEEPELARRVGAIYSYGQPRVGDAAFRDAFCAAYGDRTWRMRNAGDIVPFLLPRWLGYRHVGTEIFLSSFKGMLTKHEDIRKTNLQENVAFPFLYTYRIFAGRILNRESWLRTVYRVALSLVAPGFISHFPCDYELRLRQQVEELAKERRLR